MTERQELMRLILPVKKIFPPLFESQLCPQYSENP